MRPLLVLLFTIGMGYAQPYHFSDQERQDIFKHANAKDGIIRFTTVVTSQPHNNAVPAYVVCNTSGPEGALTVSMLMTPTKQYGIYLAGKDQVKIEEMLHPTRKRAPLRFMDSGVLRIVVELTDEFGSETTAIKFYREDGTVFLYCLPERYKQE